MTNWYAVAKALHLVGAFSWMAGLFYLVRIMVYHAQASEQPEPLRQTLEKQFSGMEWKAYKVILVPALLITWSFGSMMLFLQPVWLEQGWLSGKLFFLLLLTVYTYYCKSHILKLEQGISTFTHLHYRAMNEVPTIIMVGIIFLAVFKSGINWLYLGIGISTFSGLIFYAVKKANRNKA